MALACSASFFVSGIERRSPTRTVSAFGTALWAVAARSGLRAWRTTEWPRSARILAAPWPMPSLEPVMKIRAMVGWLIGLRGTVVDVVDGLKILVLGFEWLSSLLNIRGYAG